VVDLPDDMPKDLLEHLKTVRVAGQQLHISRDGGHAEAPGKSADKRSPLPANKVSDDVRGEVARPPEKFARKEHVERHDVTEHPAGTKKERIDRKTDVGMQTFRIEVGNAHGVKPGNIVGAIANEAGHDAKYIGRIEIFDDYSVLDLPDGMPKELLEHLKTVWVAGQQLRISHAGGGAPAVDKPVGKKLTLTAPNKGGDRRVGEKKFGDKAPFKGKGGAGNRTVDAGKSAPKPHRKGPKPG
jgi:ATP-dependent RNA helicase DeaD